MTRRLISFSSMALVALCGASLVARADVQPHFDQDATPILQMQPGLLQFVESRFDVKDMGKAKYPGTEEHPPVPPYIFRARPAGSSGPYTLRLLIEPGPPGHILNIVDMTKVHLNEPPASSAPLPAPVVNRQPIQPPTQDQPAQGNPSNAAPAPSGPTSDTPSGPITDSGSLAPPTDPPPTAH